MIIFWTAAIIVFMTVEGLTLALTSVWFAVGSAAALIAAALGAPIWLQITLFAVISVAVLLLARPIFIKNNNRPRQPTNADRIFGMVGLVTEEIDNVAATGTVSVDGKLWTARSDSGECVLQGERVKILRIEGVKLFVEKASESQNFPDRQSTDQPQSKPNNTEVTSCVN